MNKNVQIPAITSLKFVPANIIQAFLQTMAWRWPCSKPLSEHGCSVYWLIYASLGLNKLNYLSWKKQFMPKSTLLWSWLVKIMLWVIVWQPTGTKLSLKPMRIQRNASSRCFLLLQDSIHIICCLMKNHNNFNKIFNLVTWFSHFSNPSTVQIACIRLRGICI